MGLHPSPLPPPARVSKCLTWSEGVMEWNRPTTAKKEFRIINIFQVKNEPSCTFRNESLYWERKSSINKHNLQERKKWEMGTKSKTNVHLNDKPHGQIKWENAVKLNVCRELHVYLHQLLHKRFIMRCRLLIKQQELLKLVLDCNIHVSCRNSSTLKYSLDCS